MTDDSPVHLPWVVLLGFLRLATHRQISAHPLPAGAACDDPTAGMRDLDRIGKPVSDRRRTWRGFNLFAANDLQLFEAIARGEFQLTGLQNRHLQHLLGLRAGQISRIVKRLRTHGLIKKIAGAYKYYLTKLGRNVVILALKLRRFTVIPIPQALDPGGTRS